MKASFEIRKGRRTSQQIPHRCDKEQLHINFSDNQGCLLQRAIAWCAGFPIFCVDDLLFQRDWGVPIVVVAGHQPGGKI